MQRVGELSGCGQLRHRLNTPGPLAQTEVQQRGGALSDGRQRSEYTNLGKSLGEYIACKSIDFVGFRGTMVLLFLSEGVRFYDYGLFATQGDGTRISPADSVKCAGDAGDFTYWHACI